MYKILFNLILCFSFSFLQAAEEAPLIVGTNAEFPPFCYIENKEIVGFDIDIAKEVAHRMGRKIQFKDMPFDALIPELTLARLDFVAAGMSVTEERAKRVSFTKPYLSEDPLVILSTSKSNLNLDDLKGKKVIVIEGFTSDLYLSSKEGIQLIRLPTQTDGFMAMKSGRADAFVTSKSTLEAFFAVQDASAFHVSLLEGTNETCALVVPKSKSNLLSEIQIVLDEMEKDGTLNKIKTKWKLL